MKVAFMKLNSSLLMGVKHDKANWYRIVIRFAL